MPLDPLQEATFALRLWSNVSKSPYTQLLIDKVTSVGDWLPIFGGPLAKDFFSTYKNFKDQHNVDRNAIYALVVITTSILCVYYSITSPEFRGVLGLFATTFNIVKDSSSITIQTYAYVDYLLSTYAAAIVSDGILDVVFICRYGDKEFKPLALEEAQVIATKLQEDVQTVMEDYQDRIKQLRAKHTAPGANNDDIRKALIAIKNNPIVAIKICRKLDAAFNAHLNELRSCEDPKHPMLAQYKRTLYVVSRGVEAVVDATQDPRERRRSGSNVPLITTEERSHNEFPTYGSVQGSTNTDRLTVV